MLFTQDRRHVSFANRRSEVDPLTQALRKRRVCTKSQRLYFLRHVSAKITAFFADIQQMGTARFWRQANSPRGFLRSDYDI